MKCRELGVRTQFFYPKGHFIGRRAKDGSKKYMNSDRIEEDRAKFCTGEEDGYKCSYLTECLNQAIEFRHQGIWGGTSYEQRKQIISIRKKEKVQ